MSDNAWTNPAAQFEAASRMWLSAWLQPWTVLRVWGEYWRDQWVGALDALAVVPAALPPALLRQGTTPFGPTSNEFLGLFMPWLPRVEAVVTPLDSAGAGDALRLKMRATVPGAGLAGQAESLMVDAKITFASEPEDKTIEAAAAPRLVEPPAAQAPIPLAPVARDSAQTPKAGAKGGARRRKAGDTSSAGQEGKEKP